MIQIPTWFGAARTVTMGSNMTRDTIMKGMTGRTGPQNLPTKASGQIAPADIGSACDQTVRAYRQVLRDGVNRPDRDLARDPTYRALLQAGLALHRLGGETAVALAVTRLVATCGNPANAHMQRLWNGLVPDMGMQSTAQGSPTADEASR